MRQHKRPYRYALNKRERPRDAKLFYGITEKKKCQRTLDTKKKNFKMKRLGGLGPPAEAASALAKKESGLPH